MTRAIERLTHGALAIAAWLALAVPASAASTPHGGATTQPDLAPGPGWPPPVMDRMTNTMLFFELLEYRPDLQAAAWDFVGWYGGDFNRLWVKSEGLAHTAIANGVDAELQVLYGRLVTTFFDLQAGIRVDREWAPTGQGGRVLGVLGLQGLAPYVFEFEPSLFVDQAGNVSARLTASRELYLTQRTLLQARMDLDTAWQPVPALGIGAGVNDVELGLRLRHQFWREFAPYVGVIWDSRFGQTAAMAMSAGQPIAGATAVVGASIWY